MLIVIAESERLHKLVHDLILLMRALQSEVAIVVVAARVVLLKLGIYRVLHVMPSMKDSAYL